MAMSIPPPKDKKIHPKFAKLLQSTGRLSNKEPALQNTPLRFESSKKIRDAFLPTPDELATADYAKIELRILEEIKVRGITVDEEWIKSVEDENTRKIVTSELSPIDFARRFTAHYGTLVDDDDDDE